MLKINAKKYEIEEKIQLCDENDELLYEFDMQITGEELKKLQGALIGKDALKLANKIQKLQKEELLEEEANQVLELAEQMKSTAESLIGELCFKEHKEKFIELGGKTKYDEMVEVISDYLLGFFIKKQTTRTNTINSDLAKITKN